MEVLIFIVVIVFLILLIRVNAHLRKSSKKTKNDLRNIQDSLFSIQRKLDELELEKEIGVTVKQTPSEDLSSFAEVPSEKESEVVYEEYIQSQIIEPVVEEVEAKDEVVEEIETAEVQVPDLPINIQNEEAEGVQEQKNISSRKKKAAKSFLEKYPDLEKFIGENLINKIGIVILVLGLGYLVKFAIDKNWINEIGRVAIGVLSAGGLIGIAHKLRLNYKPFSSVLIGGGLALLYFTIALAFHTEGYPLFQKQTISFVILVVITLFAVFLSINYNRIEIAILAIIGGFASPLLLSTGSGNYIVLFSYIMLLNVGMLVLSYYKKWRWVNIVSFGFTALLFAIWLFNQLDEQTYQTFNGAIYFATGFFLIFFLMNILYNVKYKKAFKVGDISLILSNTFIYFSFMMLMLTHIHQGEFKGLFSVLLGAFNFTFAYLIYRRQEIDKTLLFLLIGLVFTFITLAVPLQLEGNYITLFWAFESVLLLWMSQKSGFKIMKIGSSVVLILMLISISMDWDSSYNAVGLWSEDYVKEFSLVFNKMFLTTLFAVASMVGIYALLRSEKEYFFWIIPTKVYQLIIIGLTLVVFYVGGLLEVNYQAYHYFIQHTALVVASVTYNALFILGLLIYAYYQKVNWVALGISAISALFVLVFLFLLSTSFASSIYGVIYGEEAFPITILVFRWISILAVYMISFYLFFMSKRISSIVKYDLSKGSVTFLIFTIIYLLSADLDTIGVLIANSREVLVHTQKTGYAIIWGLSSFLLMIIGMRLKNKSVRILSLVLFAITLIKLFVYDIAEISKGGKIVAFILLGVLLLIISFMYQKVKVLVTEDDPTLEKEEDQNKIIE